MLSFRLIIFTKVNMLIRNKINYLTISILAQKNTNTIALKIIAIPNAFLNTTDFIITNYYYLRFTTL